MSNAPSKPVSFSRPKVGYFSNRTRMFLNNISQFCWSRGSQCYATDGLGFDSERWQEITVISKPSSGSLPPTQPHIQWVPGAHYPMVKRRGLRGGFTGKLMQFKLQGPSDAGGGDSNVPGGNTSNVLGITGNLI